VGNDAGKPLDDSLLAVRTLHFASAALLCGLTLFLLFVGEPAFRLAVLSDLAQLNRRFRTLAWGAIVLSVLTGAAWLIILSARISGAPLGDADAIRAVLTGTTFGHVWLLRFCLVLLIGGLLLRFDKSRGWRTRGDIAGGALLCAAIIGSLAWTGHGVAGPLLESLGDAAHLVAAGGWLGGLVPFVVVAAQMRHGRPGACASLAVDVTARFSIFGIVMVAILIVSGIFNTWYLVGDLPRLVGTAYGRLLLIKIALFVAMVAIAVVNRFALMPRLRRADAPVEMTVRALERNGAIEIALGLAIVGIVSALGTMVPALHDQPIWPFAIRITFDAFSDRAEWLDVLIGVEACAVAVLLIVVGVFTPRLRWLLFAIGGIALIWFGPRLTALTAPAFPTTFVTSPTGYTAQSIAMGAELYAKHCAACHGSHGRGDGSIATNLQPPPPDLAALQVRAQPDGNLYWWITHGIGGMPPFASDPGDVSPWNLIDFIRANADAQALARPGEHAVAAPDFSLQCPDGSSPSLTDMRGRAVHIIVANADTAVRLQKLSDVALRDLQTVVVATHPGADEKARLCATGDPDVAKALSLYRGIAVAQLNGTEFLIDASGWLRAMWYPGRKPDWTQPQVLGNELAEIKRHPAAGAPSTGHVHIH
jgi:putative copper export protein/mono/diheme cytochrome c family protein